MNFKQNSKTLSKLLALIMAVVMVFGALPVAAFAEAETNDAPPVVLQEELEINSEGEDELVTELPEDNGETVPSNEGISTLEAGGEGTKVETAYTVVFRGIHSAQINSIKVYSYVENEKGETDLLDGIAAEKETEGYESRYTVDLPAGDYYVEGYDEKGYCNGGIVVSVTADGENTFTLRRAYGIYASNSGWVEGTDYEISVEAVGKDGTPRNIFLGKADNWGTVRTSCLFMDKDELKVTFTPIGDKAEKYLPLVERRNEKKTNLNIDVYGKIPAILTITVNAPKGSTVSAGTFGTYYVYNFCTPETVKETADGITATILVPETTANHFIRVQNPDGVTYWNFYKWTSDQEITVTAEDLYIGDETFTKDTVYRFDKNVYDRAGIYLNINAQGYMNMDEGETFELNVFRNWMAIEGISNAKVALPDMHYQVVDTDGNPSDVVTITPDANNSSVATVTANKSGTAIVMVTYDAMTQMQGMSSTSSKQFSAIWPELTGVYVVTVGNDGTNIATNMLIERAETNGTKESEIDAEHDILFYLGEEGATYSFTPEEGSKVSVDRSEVEDEMTFTGFTTDGVTVDAETGEVTVSGLTSGRHIIKVEKDGAANYQVVTAREVSYVMKDAQGNEIDKDTELKPGDKVQLQFSGLISPKEKLSGVYNFNFSLYYHDENGKFFRSQPGGFFGVYDFSGNPARQLIEITIPADWEGTTYTLTGAIKQGGWPGLPSHRLVTYEKGTDVVFDSVPTEGLLSVLPEITLKLEGYNAEMAANVDALIDEISDPVTVADGDKIKAAREAYDSLSDVQKELVTKLDKLETAESDYDKLMAANAEKLINELPEAGKVTSKDKDAIEAARKVYDALTDAQKELVSEKSVKKLEAVEKAYAKLVPKTGDSMNVIWFAVAIVAAACVAVVVYKKIKKA